ncbi:MAG: SurA N-terminal domain-containing protein [Synergistaceae bacterium]|nr:SurA N-terminal domain-containing protein [Synergistaceae bacterium]
MNLKFHRPSKKTTKILIVVVLFLFLLSCVIGYGFSIGHGVKSDPNDYVVAVYDGEDIMFSDLRKSAEKIIPSLGGVQITEENKYQLFQIALQNCVMDREIEKEVKARNISVKRKEVKETLQKIKDSYPSEKAFEEFLKRSGKSESDIKDELKEQLKRQHLQENIAGNITVTDAEAQQFYNQAKSQYFTTPDGVEILIAVFKDKGSADSMKQDLTDGTDWDATLAKHQDSLVTANKQEQKSIMPLSDMKGDFAFVKDLKDNEVSAVRSGPNNSFFIVKKLSTVTKRTAPFDEVKARIVEAIKNQKSMMAVNKYFSEKLKGVKVDIKDEKLFKPAPKAQEKPKTKQNKK